MLAQHERLDRVGELRAGDVVIGQVALVGQQDKRTAVVGVEVDLGAEGLIGAAVPDLCAAAKMYQPMP